MQKEHSFKLLPEYQLILESYHGRVNAQSYQMLKQREMRASGYSPRFSHLSDFRFSSVNFSQQNLENTIDFILSHPEVNTPRKSVILVSDPFTEAKLLLFKRASEKSQIDVEICQNLQHALQHLSIPVSRDFIWDQLELLRKG